jgi:hypothetical protein
MTSLSAGGDLPLPSRIHPFENLFSCKTLATLNLVATELARELIRYSPGSQGASYHLSLPLKIIHPLAQKTAGARVIYPDLPVYYAQTLFILLLPSITPSIGPSAQTLVEF